MSGMIFMSKLDSITEFRSEAVEFCRKNIEEKQKTT